MKRDFHPSSAWAPALLDLLAATALCSLAAEINCALDIPVCAGSCQGEGSYGYI